MISTFWMASLSMPVPFSHEILIDGSSYLIVALLPLSALMLITQVNPYHALVIRGILGAVAALVYALLGAADVALTEALVGTMLAITLYAIAVRSSLVMRLGVIEDEVIATGSEEKAIATPSHLDSPDPWKHLKDALDPILKQYHLRLEITPYPDQQALNTALQEKHIHGICQHSQQSLHRHAKDRMTGHSAQLDMITLTVRIRRLYDILTQELVSPAISVHHIQVSSSPIVSRPAMASKTPELVEE